MVPERGDAVAAKVVAVGHHERLEVVGGREVPLRPGMICTLVLGRRYSTLEYHGELPRRLAPGDTFDLLSIGGVAGRVAAKNNLVPGPTRLEFLGFAANPSGTKLRLSDFAVRIGTGNPLPAVILVVGTDMDTGKTAAAATAIRVLTGSGIKTAGGKLTGTSRMRDLFAMREAGAKPVLDFVDFGLPSTYGASAEQLIGMFCKMRQACGKNGCEYMAIEVADGLFQPETRQVLTSSAIMSAVSVIILAAADSVGAYGGRRVLWELGYCPHFLSGLFTAGGLKIEEVASHCPLPLLIVGSEKQDRFIEFVHRQCHWGNQADGLKPGKR
jgi:hypothetical protein